MGRCPSCHPISSVKTQKKIKVLNTTKGNHLMASSIIRLKREKHCIFYAEPKRQNMNALCKNVSIQMVKVIITKKSDHKHSSHWVQNVTREIRKRSQTLLVLRPEVSESVGSLLAERAFVAVDRCWTPAWMRYGARCFQWSVICGLSLFWPKSIVNAKLLGAATAAGIADGELTSLASLCLISATILSPVSCITSMHCKCLLQQCSIWVQPYTRVRMESILSTTDLDLLSKYIECDDDWGCSEHHATNSD